MTRKEIIKNLEAKNYDCFGDDLEYEKEAFFDSDFSSIEEMIKVITPKALARFLVEDFPERYED